MLKAAPRPDKLSEHGRNIYAYTNIRTSQVLYSLSQTLDSHASLKQLPDLGANHTPPKLRKDVWKPLWTLALPSSEPHARAQGLHAFKKLREYRKLHELNWKPSPLLNIEHERKKLDERGGSKKENVYDVIARRKWNLRVKEIMDQKATSIADLAAVLSEQDEMGQKTAAKRKDEMAIDREAEVKEILALSEAAEKGELKDLEAQLDAMRLRLESSEPDAEGKSKGMLRREFNNLFGKRARMQFAADAVADIKDLTRIQQRRAAAREEEEGRAKLAALRPSDAHAAREEAEDKAEMAASDPKDVPAPKTTAEKRDHRLRALAKEAQMGVHKVLKRKLELLRLELSGAVADGTSREGGLGLLRERIHGLRIRQGYIEIVEKALRTSPDIIAVAKDVELQLLEYAVELRTQEVAEAEAEGREAEEMEVLANLAKAKEALLEWKQSGREDNKPRFTPAEDRLRFLASKAQAGSHKHLEQKIEALRSELAAAVADGSGHEKEVYFLRMKLHKVRYFKAKVDIVEKALQTSPDIIAVQDDVHLKMQESAVELRKEELAQAKAEGRGRKEVQWLERAVEKALSQSEHKQPMEDETAHEVEQPEEVVRDEEPVAVEAPQPTSSVKAQDAMTEPLPVPTTNDEWAARLPSFPPRDIAKLPKKSELRSKLRRLASPIFSTEGVKVKWSDLLDAEFAPSWPGNVVHERMGWAKYTAPRGEQEAIENIGEWRKGVWKSRTTANWEEGAAEGEADGQGEEGVQDPEMALERQRAEHEKQARTDFIKGVKGNILRKIREGEEDRMRAMGRTLPERHVENRVEA
ncbi:hypothetical protein LTR56_004348 [Elasticomyces elasticus]|nr:hypothetical protein LTR22_012076 [Elasticomyces elasticus]KAK3653936.1 hypothetical protein LTR56_004348 [Elasticomyces elasticus]KAK4917176.1 hypothetical protein LTR49_014941 [Elasticomyces elasticus]KAK5757094.1 hypothetical protein LTS12_012768 [Elasticomyces elasticus]